MGIKNTVRGWLGVSASEFKSEIIDSLKQRETNATLTFEIVK